MLVVVALAAAEDLLAICRQLGASSKGARLIDDFDSQRANLRLFPRMGPLGNPLSTGRRAVPLLRGEYIMTYEVRDETVIIRRILYSRMDPNSL